MEVLRMYLPDFSDIMRKAGEICNDECIDRVIVGERQDPDIIIIEVEKMDIA